MSQKKLKDQAREVLKKENVKEVEPIIQEKKPRAGASGGGACKVFSNVYPVQTNNIPAYRYEVQIEAFFLRRDNSLVGVLQTIRSAGRDATQQNLYAKCREAFRKARAKDPVLKGCRLYYDLQSILYSLEQLKIPEGNEYKIQLEAAELDAMIFHGVSNVVVTIRKTDEQLTLGDLSGINTHLDQENRSLLQFIDIATNQHAFFDERTHVPFGSRRSYLMVPEEHGFDKEELPQFSDNGTYLGMGVQKGAHWVEGPSQGGKHIGLVVATKKTAFHGFETMLAKFHRLVHNIHQLQNGESDKVKRILTGLEFHTEHRGPFYRYVVKNILTDTSARQKQIEIEGEQITVEAYFKKRYNIELKEPNIPLVETRGPSYFPIELCIVSDSQRVKTDQQTSRMMQEMIRKCAVPPIKHRTHVDKMFQALHLHDSEYLRDAQIAIHKQPVEIDARILRAPELVYAQGRQTRPAPNGTWRDSGFSYYMPAGCKKWVAYAYLGPRDRLGINDFVTFTEMFAKEAVKRGMQLDQRPYKRPEIIATAHDDIKALTGLVKTEAEAGCDFFLLIHGEFDDNTHALVKVMEQRYSIATQEFRVTTVQKTVQRNQFLTVQNIVNKSNIKMGGLNYTLFNGNQVAKEIVGTDTLFIGVSVNHPSGGRKNPMLASKSDSESKTAEMKGAPSVVGFAANVGRSDEFEFVGDYIYQDYSAEIDLRTMVGVVEETLELHQKTRKRPPKRIVIYRNECSEGWFGHILQFEVPLLKEKLRKLGCKDAKLTVIAADKRQDVRFFKTQLQIDPRARPSDQNVQPGLVVDSMIVHPLFCEFFLNSHTALQGTARTPKYTVVLDENGFSLGQLEDITYQLCYGHQIVSMPTSLPSPIYIANRYAERGRKVLTQRMRISRDGVDDFELMTKELSYRSKPGLNLRRINA